MSKINLIELERTININFLNKENLILSLTHKSYNSKINNERLEFIGDRVLGLIISSELLKMMVDKIQLLFVILLQEIKRFSKLRSL